MNIEEFCSQLIGRLADTAAPEGRLEAAATEIGAFFGVQPHEVGLFRLNTAQYRLEFCWPRSLSAVGHIPLKMVNSLVAKTVNERRSFVDNAFASTHHLFILEKFLADRNERIPVQKVMSVPIVADESVRGVIQVVRKGSSQAEAGADFSASDLTDLERIAAVLGGYQL